MKNLKLKAARAAHDMSQAQLTDDYCDRKRGL